MADGSSREAGGVELIVHSLARVLGDEAAEAALHEAARQLGLSGRPLGRREHIQLFEWLAERPGLVGVAARRAQVGLAFSLGTSEPARVAAPAAAARVAKPSLAREAIRGEDLVAMFASALGDEKARELIEGECRRLSFDFESIPAESARVLLDELANTPGIVGIASRFAKARLALR
jgi:hypothetical protein